MPERKALYFLLLLFCLLAYSNSLSGSFIADDLIGISGNTGLSEPLRSWSDPAGLLSSFDYLLGGYNPFLYHLTNILLHSFNTLLVFLFLMLFFNTEAGFLGALLFALHPIHTEAVSWVSGRPYLLMASFTLGNLLLYNSATTPEKKIKVWRYLLTLVIFLYTIIDYHSFHHCLFPFLLVLFDLTRGSLKKNWKLLVPFFLAVTLKLLWGREVISHQASSVAHITGAHLLKDFSYSAYSFYAHLGLLLWPQRLTLLHEGGSIPPFISKYSLLLLTPALVFFVLLFKKAKELFLALGIFVLFLSPTFSPVPISSLIAERYLYIPSIALSITFAYLYERGCARYARIKKYILFIFIAAALACLLRTIIRNEDLNNPERFWSRTLQSSPRSWQAHSNMGFIYLSKNRLNEAVAEYEAAVALNNRSADVHNNLGVAYYKLGNISKAEENFKKALELDPASANAKRNLSNILSSNR